MDLRLDRILSESGTATRSEARALVRRGAVLVDGKPAANGEQKVDPERSVIEVNGEAVRCGGRVYLMMNKPAGYVSSTGDPRDKTVLELLNGNYTKMGLFPAGRLDKDAEGLLLLTNDGAFAHRVISPSAKVKKVYRAETAEAMRDADITAFACGLVLKDGRKCQPAGLEILRSEGRNLALVTLFEGKYHQVKRMVAARGNRVVYLRRIAIGSLALDDTLRLGEYRELKAAEADLIFK